MIRRLIILLLIVGCGTEPKDCAGVAGGTAGLDSCAVCVGGTTNQTACAQDCDGIWGGDAVSRLVGDIDGDGYITDCCDQPSCQNNPVIENNSCGEKPLGDVELFILIFGNGYCSWWPDSTTNISDDYWHNSDLCDNYYWNDFTDDGLINILDMATFAANFILYADSIPPMPPNTCFKAYVGEECCISD